MNTEDGEKKTKRKEVKRCEKGMNVTLTRDWIFGCSLHLQDVRGGL
jgi:hypothetical protein